MKVMQKDILGESHNTIQEKEKSKKTATTTKPFPTINLVSAINEDQAIADAMLNHRSLQRRQLYGNIDKEKFLRIFTNELKIKAGIIEASTATRDSLLTTVNKK